MSLSLGARSGLCFFLLVFGELVQRALAIYPDIICQPGWEWASNSMNQNPCKVATDLGAQCGNLSAYGLFPLGPGLYYQGPQPTGDKFGQECNCNTVIYSLYMACTGCQNATMQPWSTWVRYCQTQHISEYPGIIPPTTAIPHWAYLDYTVGGTFDPVFAEAAGGPESLAPIPPTLEVSSAPLLSATTSSLGTVSPSATQGNNDGGKKPSDVGAIVGGVVGGLAVLALIAIGVTHMIFIRKLAVVHAGEDHPNDTKVSTDTPTAEREIPPSQPWLYDPSDPSTYPTHFDHTQSESYPTTPKSGHYTGVPEL